MTGNGAIALHSSRLIHLLRPTRHRARRLLQAGTDAAAMWAATVLGVALRYDFAVGARQYRGAVLAGLLAAIVLMVIGVSRGLYRGRRQVGSFEELRTVVGAIVATAVILFVVVRLHRLVPSTVPVMAGAITLVLTSSYRYLWRWLRETAMRPTGESVEPIVVIGAGEAGQQIVTAMLRKPDGRYLPVALLDDDPHKVGLVVRGVEVRGGRSDLARVAARHGATVALLAIPSADSTVIREIEQIATDAGIRLLILPSLGELYGAELDTGHIRPVTTADLLGRHEVDTDMDSIAGYLTGRRVLVTGAGGSIGSELSRQIYRYAPAELVLVDRDESALHAVQLSIEGRALLDSRDLVVADIRDTERMREVFEEHRPEVVFHAAALKHLPLLEIHPTEAHKTNVWGTATMLEVSRWVGVERFVNISTDKAADPTSVLGYTKRLAERLTADAARDAGGAYLSVRFGNVLGSRGSVLTAFRRQIEVGGPVTVTDPNVTRYFMTVEEAVQLVIQAGAHGRDGDALVLDMGSPVRIDDVARRLIEESARPVEVVYTGLRPGEKLHEVLFADGEVDHRPCHPGISHVPVPPIRPDELPELSAPATGLADRLAACCRLPATSASGERALSA